MSSKKVSSNDPLSFPLLQYPIAFIDYIWVISVYVITAFYLAVLIDGYIMPPFDLKTESTYTSAYLGMKVLIQLALQGFFAIVLFAIVEKIPSPMQGFFEYNSHSKLGILVRNPAIISVILLTLSSSLRARLLYLFSRFDRNSVTEDKQ